MIDGNSTNNMNSLTCSWFTSFPVFSCSSTTGFMQFSRQRCKLSCDPAWSLQHSDEHWKALTCRGRIQSRSNLSNSLSNSLPIFSPAILITCSKAVSRLHWDVGVSAGILLWVYIAQRRPGAVSLVEIVSGYPCTWFDCDGQRQHLWKFKPIVQEKRTKVSHSDSDTPSAFICCLPVVPSLTIQLSFSSERWETRLAMAAQRKMSPLPTAFLFATLPSACRQLGYRTSSTTPSTRSRATWWCMDASSDLASFSRTPLAALPAQPHFCTEVGEWWLSGKLLSR